MAKNLNMLVVKHIANGTLSELCLVCLSPLDENSESIFTLICKEDSEFCVADALAVMCQFELYEKDNYNVCTNCFISAASAYQFHLQAKRSMELISHYTEEMLDNVKDVGITDTDVEEQLLCIPLSDYTPTSKVFDINLDGLNIDENEFNYKINSETKSEANMRPNDDLLVVVENENLSDKESNTDKAQITEDLEEEVETDDELYMIINEKKVRKKRDPMAYMKCSKCPVKYRFVAKLKKHMKTEHGIDVYYCKICKILMEQKSKYEDHLKKHSNEYHCAICNAVYKKKEKLVLHMIQHEKLEQKDSTQLENVNICEICGTILKDEESLEEHMQLRHVQRFTCYYCGRHYRSELSFEQHVRKHELAMKKSSKPAQDSKQAVKPADKQDVGKRSMCFICGKDFVDERSLLWHQRLHSNDRPYKCKECGRGFVSVNRRNQHALCAHTPPQRRCPLCPALFHLRSMVNTHVKKVHLKEHKRRNRTSKHQNVFWKTQPVPIQELSIELQNDVMELQAAKEAQMTMDIEDFIMNTPKL